MPADGQSFSALLEEWEALEGAAIAARWAVHVKQRQCASCVAGGPTPAEIAFAQDLSRKAAVLLTGLQQRLRCERARVARVQARGTICGATAETVRPARGAYRL